MKKLIYFIFILLLVSFASPALTDKVIFSYQMDSNETTITDQSGNANNGAVTGAVYTTEGYASGGYSFDGTDDYITVTRSDAKTSFGKNVTISFWTKSTDDTSSYINLVSNATSQMKIFTDNDGSAYLWASVKQGATTCYFYTRNSTIFQDSWQMLTFVYSYENNANSKIYINGSEILGIDKAACSNIPSRVDSNIIIGVTEALAVDFTGKLDNYHIWNRSLTAAEILDVYNADGILYGGAPVAQPSLSLNTNLVNNTKNYNTETLTISYNGTLANNELDVALCELYNNTQLLNSTATANLSLTNSWILDMSNKEATYYFKINCSNTETNATTGIYNYSIDTINPMIGTTFGNNSNYTLLDTITAYFNFTDANLYAYNITFKTPLGIVTENYFVENIGSSFAENLTTRTALLAGYNYTITVEAWDSHTNNYVKPLQWYFDSNNLIADDFTFEGDFKQISNKGVPLTYFYLSEDRYKLKVTFEETSLSHSIIVSAPSLTYIENSEYNAHFVHFPSRRWLDFEGKNIQETTITQLDGNRYKITVIHNYPTDEIEFESIGDLNYEKEIYYYNMVTATTDLTAIEASLSRIEEEINMNSVTVILALIAIAFWLVYVGSTLNTKNEKGKAVYINTFIKAICYSLAAFQAFIVVQMSYSFAAYSGFNQSILDQLLNNYNLVMWIGILVFVLVFIGITGNALYDGYLWIIALFRGRRA